MAATEKNQYFLSKNSPLISIPRRLSPPPPVAFGMVANQARSAWRDPLDGASDRAQPGLAQTPSHPVLCYSSPCSLLSQGCWMWSNAIWQLWSSVTNAWEEITFSFQNISFNLKRSRHLPSPPREASALCTESTSFSTPQLEPLCSLLYSRVGFTFFHMEKKIF